MDHPIKNPKFGFDDERYGPERDLEFSSAADRAGYWFAATVFFAFLAAGVIVYRAGSTEYMTASNDAPPAGTASHVHVEGVDP
jgi:hypothetical protein